jgi:hypothetical protein
MANATIDEERIKDLLRAALAEALVDNRDLVREIVEEVLEDICLARAIDEGVDGQSISREEIVGILEAEQ